MISRDFEWQCTLGAWRWLILGSLGFQASACGGRTDVDEAASAANVELGAGGSSPGSGGAGQGGRSVGSGSCWRVAGGVSAGSGSGGTSSVVVPPPAPVPVCEAPVSMGGGWVQCANGMIHRAALGVCPSTLPRPPQDWAVDLPSPDAGGVQSCREDADCTEAAHGHCEPSNWAPSYCAYGCRENADCDAGFVCLCGADIGQCQPATCASDAECNPGYFCAQYDPNPGCGGVAFACQSAADRCFAGTECPGRSHRARTKGDDLGDGSAVRRSLRQRVLREVVAPCAEALLGAPEASWKGMANRHRHEFFPLGQS